MELFELLKKTRSYRRFHQDISIEPEVLSSLIRNTRYCPSAANLQPLRYMLVTNRDMNSRIFEQLRWAAYLKDWNGPVAGERPSAYIIILGKPKANSFLQWDTGIALQTLMLSLTEIGFGGCPFGAFNREALEEILDLPDEFRIELVLAIGKPKEQVVVIDAIDDRIKYYRDEKQVHHVPKRQLSDLILRVIR